jgi:NitT/TauT family transport system substrate-binding protein
MRSILILLAAIFLAAPRASAEPVEIKVGLSGAVVTVMPLWMAQTAGIQEQQGIKIQLVNMEGGSRGLQVLLSGEIQGMSVGLAVVVPANAQGADLRIVVVDSNTIPFTIFSPPTVKTGADLKGGTVGVSTFASESDVAVSLALRQLGLTRQDVNIVQLGGAAQRLAALMSGQAKAVPLIEPTTTIALEQGLNPLVDLAAAKVPWVFDGIVVTGSYLRAHRDIVTRLVKSYVEGAYATLGDEKRAKEVIARQFKTTDQRVIDDTYADIRRLVPRDMMPSRAGAANVFDQLQALGTDVPSRKYEDYVDTSILDELTRDGFFAALAAKYNVR